jgi:hypothetical protein
MRYIFDADWIINLLAGKKDAEEKIQQFDPEEIVISLVMCPRRISASIR